MDWESETPRNPNFFDNPTSPLGDRWFRGTPSKESFFPEPLFPLGRGFTPPLPLPVDPGRADLTGSWSPGGAQDPFQERSKNHLIFSLNFQGILGALWLPKWFPKAPQNATKSTKSQPKHENDEFLKMSTSLTRDTHFRGSRVPKTPPKSTKNAPETL